MCRTAGSGTAEADGTGEFSEQAVWETLKTCFATEKVP